MNFTHDLLWKNTYNVSLDYWQMELYCILLLLQLRLQFCYIRFVQLTLDVGSNFRVVAFWIHCIRQSLLCMRFAGQEVTTLSIFSTQLLLFNIAFNLFEQPSHLMSFEFDKIHWHGKYLWFVTTQFFLQDIVISKFWFHNS